MLYQYIPNFEVACLGILSSLNNANFPVMVQASPDLQELRDALQGAMPFYSGGSRTSSAGQQPQTGEFDAGGSSPPWQHALYPLAVHQQLQQATAPNSATNAAAFISMLSSTSNIVSAEQSTMSLLATGSAARTAVTSGSRNSDAEVQQSLLEMVMGRRPLSFQASLRVNAGVPRLCTGWASGSLYCLNT